MQGHLTPNQEAARACAHLILTGRSAVTVAPSTVTAIEPFSVILDRHAAQPQSDPRRLPRRAQTEPQNWS